MRHAEPALDADLLILGGGCAGLSLAMRLATRCPSIHVKVIEPRVRYVEDRTWCGWRTTQHPYSSCVVATWPQWRVIGGKHTIRRGSRRFPYEMISSLKFYEYSLGVLRSKTSAELVLGAIADRVKEDAGHVSTTLGDGQVLRTRWVVDTRPHPPAPLCFPSLWQNFIGFEFQGDSRWTDRLGETPVLMDFQPAGTSVLQFMYVLPLGGHRFLAEWTRFSSTFGETEEIESDLRRWLGEYGFVDRMIQRRECGSLPMSVATPSTAESVRVFEAGTRGGSMRASSGYAFHAIQRWADQCAGSLAKGGPPLSPARSPLLDRLDQVFLTALQDRSAPAEAVFTRLFERTPPDALIRFMSGVPHSRDILSVMSSLPWMRFSHAALATIVHPRRA